MPIGVLLERQSGFSREASNGIVWSGLVDCSVTLLAAYASGLGLEASELGSHRTKMHSQIGAYEGDWGARGWVGDSL